MSTTPTRAREIAHTILTAISTEKERVTKAGGVVTLKQATDIAEPIIADALPKKKPVDPNKPKLSGLASDKEFLLWLEQQEIYRGLDVLKELGKCQVWCKANNRIATRRTLVNWLNRASERTIAVNGAGLSSKVEPSKDERIPEVKGWVEFLSETAYRNPNSPFFASSWSFLPREIQEKCRREIK